jgi:hypothetical protein
MFSSAKESVYAALMTRGGRLMDLANGDVCLSNRRIRVPGGGKRKDGLRGARVLVAYDDSKENLISLDLDRA